MNNLILFVYLSYDNENAYYPFGMMACTWLRDGEKENLYGYQGKEYDSLTRWHDFHARQYDGVFRKWFVVDPKGSLMPGISNYAAMMNNPVMYTDPDGECPICPIIIGAVIGGISGYIGGRSAGLRGWDLIGYSFGSAVIGGIFGGVGSAVQSSIGTATFGSYLLSYTASGIAAGAIAGGFGNALAGGDFWQGVGRGALIGGISGLVTGAVMGGIDYGQRVAAARRAVIAAGYDPKAAVAMSDAELLRFVEAHPELLQLYNDAGNPTLVAGGLPVGEEHYTIGRSGMFEARTAQVVDGQVVRGTQSVGGITKMGQEIAPGRYSSSIHVAPARFSKAIRLFMTVGHELHHAKHYYNGLFDIWLSIGGRGFAISMTETVAHQWAYHLGRSIGSEASRNATQFYLHNSRLPKIHQLNLKIRP